MKRSLLALLLVLAGHCAWAQTAAEEEEDVWVDDWGDDWGEASTVAEPGLAWNGFIEAAAGSRWQTSNFNDRRLTLGDLRVRAETAWSGERLGLQFNADLLYDEISGDVETDIRNLTLFWTADRWDFKLGRQVSTWGTGDLVFLNDLFPKDWISFFAGRDTEYLKAPATALKSSYYGERVNVDMIWTPDFTADNYITGERFSFFSPRAGQSIAPSPPFHAAEPSSSLDNGEIALRLFKNLKGVEVAAYGYRGFFKQPLGSNQYGQPVFPPLTALGASIRSPWRAGLANAEIAYYFSRDDRSGSNPGIPNDQLRLLLGYEREALPKLTVGLQYYLEWTRKHGPLMGNSSWPEFEPEEFRHVVTNRLTYLLLQDKLNLSLFSFFSPSDRDYYLRPAVAYRYSDQWEFAVGANIFGGHDAHTFFNQFEDNNNFYLRVRMNY